MGLRQDFDAPALAAVRVRYDRLKVIQEAWNTLAASVICFRIADEAAALES